MDSRLGAHLWPEIIVLGFGAVSKEGPDEKGQGRQMTHLFERKSTTDQYWGAAGSREQRSGQRNGERQGRLSCRVQDESV